MKVDYQKLYDTIEIAPTRVKQLDGIITLIRNNQSRYEAVAALIGCPWQFIACIHYRESTFNFKRHLHNGDPLTGKTTHVPKGRPLAGKPPFTWEESAVDALRLQRIDQVTSWSVPIMLQRLELFNGVGYTKFHNMYSPYIFSWSQHYKKGKYVADGRFDPEFVDGQCGVALILKKIM
jgi:lysozyme family protein